MMDFGRPFDGLPVDEMVMGVWTEDDACILYMEAKDNLFCYLS
jgi:hypothetical protein